ncbi:Nucleic-acid-binding protein from mobile element jockey [Neolecta irregularis DAH-3]|uniref:Nucleic-acid-binding protein from mobile element jockey n=1 Tax=Neolecta irregularis (strain DAH-3) TaxID=1198029 RepID=A0A1U7LJ74_NEOID|nr:Nucleic-acid-binding protein from mobile element jockey [Neolecta irregularis DAH-3]|eukprot:OLL22716.1 Nucleic-acid-binding protein from mobile element jockey [Neolecta irregularis DAH-3]
MPPSSSATLPGLEGVLSTSLDLMNMLLNLSQSPLTPSCKRTPTVYTDIQQKVIDIVDDLTALSNRMRASDSVSSIIGSHKASSTPSQSTSACYSSDSSHESFEMHSPRSSSPVYQACTPARFRVTYIAQPPKPSQRFFAVVAKNLFVADYPISQGATESIIEKFELDNSNIPGFCILNLRWLTKPNSSPQLGPMLLQLSSLASTHAAIQSGLNIDGVVHPLTRFHPDLILCGRCYEWGHFIRGCKARNPTCGYCSKPHMARSCKTHSVRLVLPDT